MGGDIEQMPLKDSCAGLVWSNLTLQWCNDLKQTIAEVHRVLQVNGLFMFSTFGPDTLKELRQAFRERRRITATSIALQTCTILATCWCIVVSLRLSWIWNISR